MQRAAAGNAASSGSRGSRRAPPVAGALLLAAISIAACGTSTRTLSRVRVERAIADSILSERGVSVKVACPAKVPQRVRQSFTCEAHLGVGVYPVHVTETDGAGHVRYGNARPLVVLRIANVERAIEHSILAQRGLRSQVACPAQVLQMAGVVFTCRATVNGRSYPFRVSEADDRGHVRYVGR
jgi:hypothetical protein